MSWLIYLKCKTLDQPNSQVSVVIKQLYTKCWWKGGERKGGLSNADILEEHLKNHSLLYYFAKHSSQPFFSTSPSKNTGTPSAFGCIFGFLMYKLWHSQLPDNNIVSQERMVGYLLSIWWSVSVMYSYEWHNLQKVWDEWCFWLRMSIYHIYWTNPFHFSLHSTFLHIY